MKRMFVLVKSGKDLGPAATKVYGPISAETPYLAAREIGTTIKMVVSDEEWIIHHRCGCSVTFTLRLVHNHDTKALQALVSG
jgi:hypothetical protein